LYQLGVVLLAVPATFAWNPIDQRADVARSRPLGATVSGSVVTGDARIPVRGALVQIDTGSDAKAFVTGLDGRFVLRGVPARSVSLRADKAGYFPAQYGQTQPNSRPARLTLTDGAKVDDLVLVMWPLAADSGRAADAQTRACAISGRVLDQNGDPILGWVAAIAIAPDVAIPDPKSWRTQAVAADGRYCLSDLPPARYLVRGSRGLLGEVRAPDGAGGDRRVAYLPTYYPDAASSAAADSVTVTGVSEVTDIDLHVYLVPVAPVTVRLSALGDQPLVPQVAIMPSDEKYGGRLLMTSTSNDRHEYIANDLPAGRYTVIATGTDPRDVDDTPRPRWWASGDVISDGLTPVELALVLGPGARVSGRVSFSSTSPAQVPPLVWLDAIDRSSVESGFEWGGSVKIADDGTFVIDSVLPGRYVVQAADQKPLDSPRWSLVAATRNGQDLLDLPVELVAGREVNDVILTLSDRVTELSGSVTDGVGRPAMRGRIVAFPPDSRYWWPQSRRVKWSALGPSGTYEIRDLPPGEYRVAFVTSDDDPPLAQLLQFGTVVTIAPGEHRTLDLQVSRAPVSQARPAR
jgi:hypothetical protein